MKKIILIILIILKVKNLNKKEPTYDSLLGVDVGNVTSILYMLLCIQ